MSMKDESQEEMLWKRSMNESVEDVWDDKALVNAYDRAVKQVNRRLADKCLRESQDKHTDKSTTDGSAGKSGAQSWRLGDYCRTTYTEDGIEYEAQIISIDTTNDTCFVKYMGYGNEEQHPLNQLRPSFGKRWRKQQIQQSSDGTTQEVNSNSDTDYEPKAFTTVNQMTVNEDKPNANKSHNRVNGPTSAWFPPSQPMPSTQPIIPPPITMNTNSAMPSDDESLASMLMSWYMSGYHTGYYTALKQSRQQSTPNKSNTN